jgi:hypothetical protein
VIENDFAIAWTAPARRTPARLHEKAATATVEFLYGSLAANLYRRLRVSSMLCDIESAARSRICGASVLDVIRGECQAQSGGECLIYRSEPVPGRGFDRYGPAERRRSPAGKSSRESVS